MIDDVGAGTLIAGKFRMESVLGQGGMGTVWAAIQEPLGRRVALKLIRTARADVAERERFRREATLVAQLRCPHIVTLFDFGEHEGAPYIAMELLEGETLRQRLHKGPLPLEQALNIARDIACGLRTAHEMGIIHRDLKPENVVIVPDKDRAARAKLLDFGIAKLAKGAEGQETSAGIVVGTPGYIAPEIAMGGRSDEPRSDLYALGVLLFEMVTGAPPYSAATSVALIMKHATQPVPDPRTTNPDVPSDVAALVMRLLAKEPEARAENADAIVRDLDKLRAAAFAKTESVELPISITGAAALVMPERPSIAVQPFVAVGSDDDAVLAEGISEDILIALSCFRQLFVVAQTSMWQPGGRDTDALRVGRRLGVHYVLQGSVRRSSGRMRISAVLVDTLNGAQVWAQRYDRDVADLFAVQDEVTQAIVACVVGRVEQAHIAVARKKTPDALQAYDWLARGRAYHHLRTPEDNARSREALDKAIQIDPHYAQAHAWRACALGQAITMDGDAKRLVPEMRIALGTALSLDDGDAECHRLASELGFRDNDLGKAEAHHLRAIALNPNDARIVAQRGELAVYQGRFAEAVEALAKAVRLDPIGEQPFLRHLARARYLTEDFDGALKIVKQLEDTRIDVRALGAAVLAARGDTAGAAASADRVRALDPTYSASRVRLPFATDELWQRWLKGFVAAGLG